MPMVSGASHVSFSVRDVREALDWFRRVFGAEVLLDALGAEHSGPIPVPPGVILNFKGPDGIALALLWRRPS